MNALSVDDLLRRLVGYEDIAEEIGDRFEAVRSSLEAIVSVVSAMQALGERSKLDGSPILTQARAALASANGVPATP